MLSLRLWSVSLGVFALVALCAGVSWAIDVLPGYDLFETGPPTFQGFWDALAVPPDFFGPGSDPFEGQVAFKGEPLGSFPTCPGSIGQTDMIVLRTVAAVLPGPDSSDVIPIEIIALSLISVDPITVTYQGGTSPELWDVQMGLSTFVPSRGTMTVRQTSPLGGTFDSTIPVVAKFVFTHVPSGETRTLDWGPLGLSDYFYANDVPWQYDSPPNRECPSCCSNFYPSAHTETAPYAQHTVLRGCPEGSAGVPENQDSQTWGAVKSLYR
jgi:hypothetical protein